MMFIRPQASSGCGHHEDKHSRAEYHVASTLSTPSADRHKPDQDEYVSPDHDAPADGQDQVTHGHKCINAQGCDEAVQLS
eukprot:5033986-Heterocapsa_arctica.AAC.1